MLIIRLKDCPEFTAGDHSRLREILHPDRNPQTESNAKPKEEKSPRYSLAHATVPPGKATIPHRLQSSELYYILQGRGRMYIDDEARDVGTSDTVYIPPRAAQHIVNTADCDLTFLCIVDPAWQLKDEEIMNN